MKVLFALTHHYQFTSDRLTGSWLSEITHPYDVLAKNDIEVVFATPVGGNPPIDPLSVDLSDSVNRKYVNNDEFRGRLRTATDWRSISFEDIEAVVFQGGHGTLWDFPEQPWVRSILEAFDRENKIIGCICHGAAALLGVMASRRPYVYGRKITAFTNTEEKLNGTLGLIPFSVQTKLMRQGAVFEEKPPRSPNVVVDGNLISAQNPESGRLFGEALVKALKV